MAFVADNKALRTYDPERGLELKTAGGGSDGHRSFVIHRIGDPNDVLVGITAYLEVRSPTDEELRVYPEAKDLGVWVILRGRHLKGYSQEDSKAIIREAMLAFRAIHGAPLDGTKSLFDVKF